MKLPRFLAIFLNWVEGEEVLPVPARKSASPRSSATKQTTARKAVLPSGKKAPDTVLHVILGIVAGNSYCQ